MPPQKRPRIDQILNDLDEIGEKKPSALATDLRSTEFVAAPEILPASNLAAQALSAPRRAASGDAFSSKSRSPVTPSSPFGDGSVFSSELERQNKRLEDTVDMALFLAQTYAASVSSNALFPLVRHLSSNGAKKVVNAVKRSGQLKPFVAALCAVPRDQAPASRADLGFLRFYRFIADVAPAEVLCSKSMFLRVLRALDPNRASVPTVESSSTAPAAHWSQRFKKTTAAGKPAVDPADGQLEDALTQLLVDTPHYMEDSRIVTCVEILLKLVFNYNQAVDSSFGPLSRSNSGLGGEGGAVLLLHLGGFPILESVLQGGESTSEERLKVLQLLDVVTCSGSELADEVAAKECFESILGTVMDCLLKTPAGEEFLTALRVAINITSLFPSAAMARTSADSGMALLAMLQTSADPTSPQADCHVYLLCLAINMLCKGKNTLFCNALTTNEEFLRFAAAEMRRLHTAEDAESNVAAGYYATLLGMVSLASQESRVSVKHALGWRGSRLASPGSQGDNPLKYVVAILQEFVLFQSSAGILTQEALVGIHRLLQSLLEANGDITVDSSLDDDES
jgi:hypothetical protein